MQRRRRSLGCGFLANDDGIRPLLNELRAGRSVGLVVDLRVDSGDLVPFCGHDTMTTLVPARLALKFGCPLVPVWVERLRPAHLRVTLHDPVPPDDAVAPDLRAWRMTARINALFEVLDRRAARPMAVLPEPLVEGDPTTGTPSEGARPAGSLRSRRGASQAASGGVRSTSSSASWRT